MLTKFLGLFRQNEVTDPFFGTLRYMSAARGKLPYWEGGRPFGPSDKSVEVFVDAVTRDDGPSEAQREFFRWVERDYKPICAVVEGSFRTDPWAKQLLRGDFESEFSISSFTIPLCRGSAEEWQLTFDAAADEEHIFTIYLAGMEARGISIDG